MPRLSPSTCKVTVRRVWKHLCVCAYMCRYPKDYSNTYMHLSTPALFAPFVRLELLHWDPLYADEGQTQRRAADAAANGAGEREGVHKGFDKQAW